MKKLPKKDRVPDSKRFSIITERMDRCYICNRSGDLKAEDFRLKLWLHEVFGGSGKRELSKYYGLVVPLCMKCHEDVHKRKEDATALKQVGQKFFEVHYPNEDFIDVFGRNYL